MTEKKTGISLLRDPFPANHISKLPKPTKAQTDEVKDDYKKGIRCGICGGWHHPKVVHLDYVGHAALTDRLLDADPAWYWEPLALGDNGYPVIDSDGGMWIKLTVGGVTRLGYGDAQGKSGGDAMKERIGDALRNAAMRFGAALDLWHKGDFHVDEKASAPPSKATPVAVAMQSVELDSEAMDFLRGIATDLVRLVEAEGDTTAAYDHLEAQKLDNDEKIALWSILQPNSKTRSAIKKEGDSRKAKQSESKE